jgi:hypothetical protein
MPSKDKSKLRATHTNTCPTCDHSFHPWKNAPGIYCSHRCSKLGERSMPIETRFWSKVDRSDLNGCWPWTAFRQPAGYGYFQVPDGTFGVVKGKSRFAHRVAWMLFHKQLVPDGLCILHTCDNPPCCNPAHLFLGTTDDNNKDAAVKGRKPRGSLGPTSILKENQVRTIRRLLSLGTPQKVIARKFNVSVSAVSHISTRYTWDHLK